MLPYIIIKQDNNWKGNDIRTFGRLKCGTVHYLFIKTEFTLANPNVKSRNTGTNLTASMKQALDCYFRIA